MTHRELYDIITGIQNDAECNRPKNWRYGQAIFNYAEREFPKIVNELRGSDIDCFHNDNNIINFLATIYYKYDIQ